VVSILYSITIFISCSGFPIILALKLEEALSELHSSEQNRKNEKTNDVQKLKETKCYKCKGNCKTRAALCLKGHWVHYICDKLTEFKHDILSIFLICFGLPDALQALQI
jgi:hypothetical protein